MRNVIEEVVVVVCQGESYLHGRVPCDRLVLLFGPLGEAGGRKVAEPCTGVPPLADRKGPAGLDAVHLCLFCVSFVRVEAVFLGDWFYPHPMRCCSYSCIKVLSNKSPPEMVAEQRLRSLNASRLDGRGGGKHPFLATQGL